MTDAPIDAPPVDSKPRFTSKPLTLKLWQLTAILFGVLILGAMMGGSTGSADAEKAETELAEVKHQLKLANEQSETIQAGAKSADAEAKELLKKNQEKAKELDQAAKDLAVREAKLSSAEAQKKLEAELTTFANGVHEVGTDIRPGKYKTDGSSGCYWAKLEANDDIIDNDLPGGPSTVTIEPTVAKFQSKNCGTWTKVG